MARGRSDRPAPAPGPPPPRPPSATDLIGLCPEIAPDARAWEVAHALPWSELCGVLTLHPGLAGADVSVAEGDYDTEEEWVVSTVTTPLLEVMADTLGLDPATSWAEACEALAAAGEEGNEVSVVEGDYGWDGWVEYEVRRPLSEIVCDALGGVLAD